MVSVVEKLEGLERRLKVIVTKEEVEEAYKKRIDEVAKSAAIKGFRPGKVPIHIIQQRFGKDVHLEVAGKLMESSFQSALTEHQLNIAGQPKIESQSVNQGEPLEYLAVFEVYPEINLKELGELSIEKEVAQVTDADIQKMLENIRKQQAHWHVVDRSAKLGDRITIDFTGYLAGEAFTGGDAKDFDLELGAKKMVPGFEEALEGVKAGEEKEIQVTFPQEYGEKNLAGKLATFKIKVHQVQEAHLPDINDDLAKKVGVEGGLPALLADLRKGMEKELNRLVHSKLKSKVFDKLIELNALTLPKGLIEAEIHYLQDMTKQQVAMQQGLQEVPKMDLPRGPYIKQAEKRVALGLLLAEIIKKYQIKVDADKVREKIQEAVSPYKDAEQMMAWYYKNKKIMSEIEAAVLEEQVVEKLLENVTLIDAPSSYDEIMRFSQVEE